jgi:hypothetical protein
MERLFTRLLTVGLLAGSLAMAATYKFNLSDPVLAGKTQLQPGKYSVDVTGQTAVLKDKAGKTIDVKAKVEQLGAKAAATTFGISDEAGARTLASITLGGSQLRVIFE